ncbi:MAG: hypothetical protein ACE5MK_02875, partial [Acidobacteriota bacterium]
WNFEGKIRVLDQKKRRAKEQKSKEQESKRAREQKTVSGPNYWPAREHDNTTAPQHHSTTARKHESTAAGTLVQCLLCALALFSLFSSPAFAQGCALCKAAIAAQTASFVQALNLGIVVLLVPPIAIMSSILFIAFRRDK